jgi:hypothetical protein
MKIQPLDGPIVLLRFDFGTCGKPLLVDPLLGLKPGEVGQHPPAIATPESLRKWRSIGQGRRFHDFDDRAYHF